MASESSVVLIKSRTFRSVLGGGGEARLYIWLVMNDFRFFGARGIALVFGGGSGFFWHIEQDGVPRRCGIVFSSLACIAM